MREVKRIQGQQEEALVKVKQLRRVLAARLHEANLCFPFLKLSSLQLLCTPSAVQVTSPEPHA